jgi:hypothetical protein
LDRYNIIHEIVNSHKFNAKGYYKDESKQDKRDKVYKKLQAELTQPKKGGFWSS